MSTPLANPVTLNLTLSTQEDLLAFLLRANLDADNLRYWYHEHRNRPNVHVPDTRMTDIFKALKAHMEEEGFSMEGVVDNSAEAGKTLDIGLNS